MPPKGGNLIDILGQAVESKWLSVRRLLKGNGVSAEARGQSTVGREPQSSVVEPSPSLHDGQNRATKRSMVYGAVGFGLLMLRAAIRGIDVQGYETAHVAMEIMASALAAVVGSLAVVRYHTLKETVYLFVGSGFLGAALLDGAHAAVGSAFAASLKSSPATPLFLWSGVASRLLLSTFFVLSWLAGRSEDQGKGERVLRDRFVPVLVVTLIFVGLLLFGLVSWGPVNTPLLWWGRPIELVPAALFALALVGCWRRRAWIWGTFDHWLILVLVVGFVSQAVFLSGSQSLLDAEFHAGNLLKLVAYSLALVGVLDSLFSVRRHEKAAQEALSRVLATSERTLHDLETQRSAIDHHAIISATDRAGTITYANDLFCSISQYSRDELIGQNHRILKSSHHSDEFFAEMWATISTGSVWSGAICNRAKDGSLYWVQSTLVPLVNLEGKAEGYLGIRTDITNQKGVEESVRRTAQELERSNKELDSFAYIASHDLKEPLRGIHNYSQFVIEDSVGQLDATGRERLETIKALAKRMDDLISTLLRFSRVGRKELELSLSTMRTLVEEAIESVGVSIEESSAVVSIAHDLPDSRCDVILIRQVLQNLVANAIKYCDKEPPRVTVGWESGDRGPVYFVRDNGIGIREKDLETIFVIFKRLHARHRFGGGLGAGLTIAKKIVEKHGGQLWVESEFGVGSTFFFTLHREDFHGYRSASADPDRGRQRPGLRSHGESIS